MEAGRDRIRDLFRGAFERLGEDLGAVLDEACADDPGPRSALSRNPVIPGVVLWACVAALAQRPASAQHPRATGEPRPRYEIAVEKDIMVPMRDGVRLATDLY